MTDPPAPHLAPPTGRGRLTLAIETSNPSSAEGEGPAPGVALGRVGVDDEGRPICDLLGAEPLDGARRADADLVPAIDRLARRVGVAPGDLERVAVSLGPGGYTSVRIAAAAGQMIAEVTGAAGVPVATALVVSSARLAEPGAPAGPFLVALASKRDSAWVVAFDADGRPRPDGDARPEDHAGSLLDAEGFAALLDQLEKTGAAPVALRVDRFLPEAMRAVADARGLAIEAPGLSAEACLRASAWVADGGAETLRPMYPREPEAVRKWEELGRA